jgi:hypothetical protein
MIDVPGWVHHLELGWAIARDVAHHFWVVNASPTGLVQRVTTAMLKMGWS